MIAGGAILGAPPVDAVTEPNKGFGASLAVDAEAAVTAISFFSAAGAPNRSLGVAVAGGAIAETVLPAVSLFAVPKPPNLIAGAENDDAALPNANGGAPACDTDELAEIAGSPADLPRRFLRRKTHRPTCFRWSWAKQTGTQECLVFADSLT